jgi:hypothetical protein
MAATSSHPRREQDERVREGVAALPAVYVDGWFTTTWRDHIRIVLSETLYDTDQWRFAFVMEWGDAEKFVTHIQEAIAAWKLRYKDDESPDTAE